MMETWRLNVNNKNDTPIRRAFDPGTSRPIVQQACNTCRAKKHASVDIEGSAIKGVAHRLSTPFSDSAGNPDPGHSQPESTFTFFGLYTDVDQHGHISSLNDPDDLQQWPLIDNIDVEHCDSSLVTPPDDPMGLTSAPQDSVLPSGPTPANEVSQPPNGLTDLLSRQDSRSFVEPTSPALQFAHPPSEPAVCSGSTAEDITLPECRCLQPVVFLIDELEAGHSTVASQGLDAGLASHKEALRYGRALLDCQRCRGRPEHMTILKFLTDKLAGLSEQIVAEYARCLLLHHAEDRDPGATGEMITAGACGAVDRDNRSNSGAPPWPAVLGSYEVDSPREWDALMGALIALQLEALHSLADSMKAVSRSMRWDAMCGKAAATQRRIAPMLYRVRSLCRPGGGGGGGGGTADATVPCDRS
ncbi:hypothetical protein SLS63_012081 [Diaporthe eres]|uniref:Uncharacterized protein n=1 Tax=Diaporthe eres TaxID=83184 RepID=A0ABR1NSD4_DIAER